MNVEETYAYRLYEQYRRCADNQGLEIQENWFDLTELDQRIWVEFAEFVQSGSI